MTKVTVSQNMEIDITHIYNDVISLINELTLPEEQHKVATYRVNEIFGYVENKPLFNYVYPVKPNFINNFIVGGGIP